MEKSSKSNLAQILQNGNNSFKIARFLWSQTSQIIALLTSVFPIQNNAAIHPLIGIIN